MDRKFIGTACRKDFDVLVDRAVALMAENTRKKPSDPYKQACRDTVEMWLATTPVEYLMSLEKLAEGVSPVKDFQWNDAPPAFETSDDFAHAFLEMIDPDSVFRKSAVLLVRDEAMARVVEYTTREIHEPDRIILSRSAMARFEKQTLAEYDRQVKTVEGERRAMLEQTAKARVAEVSALEHEYGILVTANAKKEQSQNRQLAAQADKVHAVLRGFIVAQKKEEVGISLTSDEKAKLALGRKQLAEARRELNTLAARFTEELKPLIKVASTDPKLSDELRRLMSRAVTMSKMTLPPVAVWESARLAKEKEAAAAFKTAEKAEEIEKQEEAKIRETALGKPLPPMERFEKDVLTVFDASVDRVVTFRDRQLAARTAARMEEATGLPHEPGVLVTSLAKREELEHTTLQSKAHELFGIERRLIVAKIKKERDIPLTKEESHRLEEGQKEYDKIKSELDILIANQREANKTLMALALSDGALQNEVVRLTAREKMLEEYTVSPVELAVEKGLVKHGMQEVWLKKEETKQTAKSEEIEEGGVTAEAIRQELAEQAEALAKQNKDGEIAVGDPLPQVQRGVVEETALIFSRTETELGGFDRPAIGGAYREEDFKEILVDAAQAKAHASFSNPSKAIVRAFYEELKLQFEATPVEYYKALCTLKDGKNCADMFAWPEDKSILAVYDTSREERAAVFSDIIDPHSALRTTVPVADREDAMAYAKNNLMVTVPTAERKLKIGTRAMKMFEAEILENYDKIVNESNREKEQEQANLYVRRFKDTFGRITNDPTITTKQRKALEADRRTEVRVDKEIGLLNKRLHALERSVIVTEEKLRLGITLTASEQKTYDKKNEERAMLQVKLMSSVDRETERIKHSPLTSYDGLSAGLSKERAEILAKNKTSPVTAFRRQCESKLSQRAIAYNKAREMAQRMWDSYSREEQSKMHFRRRIDFRALGIDTGGRATRRPEAVREKARAGERELSSAEKRLPAGQKKDLLS